MKPPFAALSLALALVLTLGLTLAAAALTPEEVIRLKKAGVSDETIQLMLKQERAGQAGAGPMEEAGDQVIYKAGQSNRAQRDENQAHERWKEEKALDAVGGVVIDARPGQGGNP